MRGVCVRLGVVRRYHQGQEGGEIAGLATSDQGRVELGAQTPGNDGRRKTALGDGRMDRAVAQISSRWTGRVDSGNGAASHGSGEWSTSRR